MTVMTVMSTMAALAALAAFAALTVLARVVAVVVTASVDLLDLSHCCPLMNPLTVRVDRFYSACANMAPFWPFTDPVNLNP